MKVGDRVEVTATSLNGRSSPNGPITLQRPKGFQFTITDLKDGWASGGKNWYSTKFLRPVSASSAKVASPVPGYKVSTPYGKKPNNRTYWQARGYHTGDDYAAPAGANVVAVLDGTIRHRADGVLGTVILLYANDGNTYWYCHLSKRVAANGARVKAGQSIGKVGSTGSGAKGPHLHFEKRRGHTTSWSGKDYKPTW